MSNDLTKQSKTFDVESMSMKDMMDYAKLIADSDLAPKDYKGKPGNVIIAMQFGAEIGLKPMQAIQNIAVINGRPSVWGDALLALILNHPVCEYVKEFIKDDVAYCVVKRRNESESYTASFSKADAKQAGLLSKPGVWQQYPNRMLQMRARSFALRDKFADVLKGLSIAEEVLDYMVIDTKAELKNKAKDTITNLLNPKTELIEKIENALTLDDLKEAKNLLKEKHAEIINKETGEINEHITIDSTGR